MTIDIYTVATANGERIHIALEELDIDYRLHPVDMARGAHRSEAFLELNPFGRAPVMVDREGYRPPLILAETTAILVHLACRTGRLLPTEEVERLQTLQWLAMIAANAAPAFRGEYHFAHQLSRHNAGACAYFKAECATVLGAIEMALAGREYLVGNKFSIADIQCFPLLATSARRLENGLDPYPNLCTYRDRLAQRPGFRRGMAILKNVGAPSSDGSPLPGEAKHDF
ncbi:MAG: glutathione S-transferase family protein [Novosphingobium sp.]